MRDPNAAVRKQECLAVAHGIREWRRILPCPSCGAVGSAGHYEQTPLMAEGAANPKGLVSTINWGELKCRTCGHFTDIATALATAMENRAAAYPTPTPSSGEEVQAAMELARIVELGERPGPELPMGWNRKVHFAEYEKALLRYRASKPAPSGGRGGA